MQEATEAFQALKALRADKEKMFIERSEKKPAPFKFVKVTRQASLDNYYNAY